MTVSLAGRIAKNRQLKLLSAQRRHMKARFMEILGDAHVKTTRLNDRHFESTVYYPLSPFCHLRLASEIAESFSDSVERVYGSALSILYTKADLRHMLQVVDSDVFAELNLTLRSMCARAIVHLVRAEGGETTGEAARFTATVTAELPLTENGEVVSYVAGVGIGCEKWRDFNGEIRSDVALCRSSGQCLRDTIKAGLALALAELDDYAVEEQRSRENEAFSYLRSALHDELLRDWRHIVLSAFLSSSLGNTCAENAWWDLACNVAIMTQVSFSLTEKRKSLEVSVTDCVGNETIVLLPLQSPPSVFQRVLVNGAGNAKLFTYGSALVWPNLWVVSVVLMQLCAVLNADVGVEHAFCEMVIGDVAGSKRNSLSTIGAFLDAHSVLPSAVPYTVEWGLFIANSLMVSNFVRLTKEGCVGGSGMPLICLKLTDSLSAQGHVAQLGISKLENTATSSAYHDFVADILRMASSIVALENVNRGPQRRTQMSYGLLGCIWGLLSAIVTVVAVEKSQLFRDFSVWFPAEPYFGYRYRKLKQSEERQQLLQFAIYIGQLFAADAQVSEETFSTRGVLPKALILSCRSLEVVALRLCHFIEPPEEICNRLFYTFTPPILVASDSEVTPDLWRGVENATRQRQLEQSLYYCPDIILMIHEMRLALNLPQRSFPTLEFFQRAVHDVPQRVRELALGRYGDVPIYTRVVAHWGANLRVEAESGPKDVVDNGKSFYSADLCGDQQCQGPLKLLLSVVCDMYKRIFPNRTTVPLVSLNSTSKRRSIDFLLYSWFMASPQVRCFEISTRTARLVAASNAEKQNHWDLAEVALSHYVNNHIVRAMLFYDFCGQRVLFAETHAPTVHDAVWRVSKLAVSLNIPVNDAFPQRSKIQRGYRRLSGATVGYNSKVLFLLKALVAATHSHVRVCFVRTNEYSTSSIEGAVEVHVPFGQIRSAVSVTETRGVIPAVIAACHKALCRAVGEAEADLTLGDAEDVAPLIPRDDFPHFSARFYTPVNLLGEVLQGVACRYDCTYTMNPQTHEIVCLLHVAALAGYENAAPDKVPFLLGVGRGCSKRSAWASAALQALQTNFPDVMRQVERHKELSALLRRPDDLSWLNCSQGFRFEVSSKSGGNGKDKYRCTVTGRRLPPKDVCGSETVNCTIKIGDEKGKNKDYDSVLGHATIVLAHDAHSAVDAYVGAADALLERLRQCKGAVDSGFAGFTMWDPTSNYGKSVWHACCGALGVAFGGKVFLRFEGGREDANLCESKVPMRVQLVLRTWSCTDSRMVESHIHTLHEGRIVEYSALTGLNAKNGPSAEQLLFASTRFLVEAIGKYLDAVTRKELKRLLTLFCYLRDEEQSCHRLGAKRRVESCIELTFGCQSRVVVHHAVSGVVAAEAGIWLPGWCRRARVPIVLFSCTADTTESVLSELEHSVKRFLDPLWTIVIQSCAQ